MAAEMAVESTAQEMETTVQEGRSVRAEIAQEDHSEITLREEAASAATVQDVRSVRVQIVQDVHSARVLTVQEDHSERVTREELTEIVRREGLTAKVEKDHREELMEKAETVHREGLMVKAETVREDHV